MRAPVVSTLVIMLMVSSAVAKPALKTCSGNRAYCEAAAKKQGWTHPQCADAYNACMSTGEWHTSGQFGRTVQGVERR
ncbi:hypothetical protein ACVILK_000506 [Bradyrhizobium embrapense]